MPKTTMKTCTCLRCGQKYTTICTGKERLNWHCYACLAVLNGRIPHGGDPLKQQEAKT